MDILNPPKNYIDYRCAIHGKDGAEFEEARRKFYKNFPCEEEIKKCFNWLRTARDNMNLPQEKIEVKESDSKKHGRIVLMMIYDIEYWREAGQVKQRKIYIPYRDASIKDNRRPDEYDYPYIRNIPKQAWKRKEWPITAGEALQSALTGIEGIPQEIAKTLSGKTAEEFEKKCQAVKERLPYKDD